MVETDTNQSNSRTSDVKDEIQQVNGVGSSPIASRPAIIQTSSGALVPFRPASDNNLSSEEQYRPFDPERGHASAHSLNQQQPPPYNDAAVARADFETAIEQTGYGKFHYILLGICGEFIAEISIKQIINVITL